MHYINGDMKSNDTVEEIRKDRKAGAARLVAEYRNRLYDVACSVCGDSVEAEDLVFRTFEQVIAKIGEYREEEAFFAWMCTILRNYYRMSIRGNVTRNTVPSGGLDELAGISGEVGDEDIAKALDGDILRKAVDELPPKLRETVVLHYFMDQPVRKVAKMLSVSDGTVKSRLYYARVVLGTRLCAAVKKPTVALVFAVLFVVAAVSAVSFAVFAPPQVAEVDEPVFLNDAPLEEDADMLESWGGVPMVPVNSAAVTKAGTSSGAPEPRRSAKTAIIPAFRSDGKDSRKVPVPSFNSVPNSAKVIISR